VDQHGFIAHTVTWALTRVVKERRYGIRAAGMRARTVRQLQDGLWRRGAATSGQRWGKRSEEIARRVETEGHAPVSDRPWCRTRIGDRGRAAVWAP
jgi:hypothetical protein